MDRLLRMLAETRHVETVAYINRAFRLKATQSARMVAVRMAQDDPRHFTFKPSF